MCERAAERRLAQITEETSSLSADECHKPHTLTHTQQSPLPRPPTHSHRDGFISSTIVRVEARTGKDDGTQESSMNGV